MRLNGSAGEAVAHELGWHRMGGRKSGQRLGQYLWNMMGAEGSWPELFYTESEDVASYLVHEYFNNGESHG